MGININHQTETLSTHSTILKHSDVGGFIVANGDNVTQKPSAAGNNGLIRYNTTNNVLEAVINGAYVTLSAASDLTNFLHKTGDSMTGVLGLIAGTSVLPALSFASDTASGLYQPAIGYLGLSANGVERLRIDSSGNVGIGAASSGYRLSITQSGNTQAYFGSTGSNNSIVTIDNAAGSFQSALNFTNAGTSKWQMGKQTNNSFFLYDNAASATFISAVSGASLTLGPIQNVTISQVGTFSVVQAGSTQAYFGSTGANSCVVSLNTGTTSNASIIQLQDAGTAKWSIQKNTDLSLSILDIAGSKTFVKAITGGNLILGAGQNVTVSQGGTLSVVQASNTQAYFGSTGPNSSIVTIDNAAGTQVSALNLNNAGTTTWAIQKNTDNSLSLYDSVGAATFVKAVTSGSLYLGAAQNFTIDQTGNAATLTQSSSDNSTKVATTAFSKAIRGMASVNVGSNTFSLLGYTLWATASITLSVTSNVFAIFTGDWSTPQGPSYAQMYLDGVAIPSASALCSAYGSNDNFEGTCVIQTISTNLSAGSHTFTVYMNDNGGSHLTSMGALSLINFAV